MGESTSPIRPMIAPGSQAAAGSHSIAEGEQKKKLELADSAKGEESFCNKKIMTNVYKV